MSRFPAPLPALLLALSTLCACGQKGALTLPDSGTEPVPATPPAAPAAAPAPTTPGEDATTAPADGSSRDEDARKRVPAPPAATPRL